jgi:uncharacterized protein YndB with AHSA1/START domain
MVAKEKIQLEYPMHCTPKVLYLRLSTPAGLEEWFADQVNMVDPHTYVFSWDDTTQKAKIIAAKDMKFIRFKWIDDKDSNSFFEFKITIDELTSDLSLVIVDFVLPSEKKDAIKLWDKQIAELKHILGSN